MTFRGWAGRPGARQLPRTVLLTGAGSGLGLRTAVHLAERGSIVYGCVLNNAERAALAEAGAHAAGAIRSVQLDVTDRQQIDAAVTRVIADAGRIDALVQFAGLGLRGFFEDLAMEEIRRVYDVNVFGVMSVTQAVLPHMRAARRGRIVIVSSVAGRIGTMSISGYASSKFAVEGFAECLSQEVAPFGISVSLLEPGLVLTPHFTVNRNRALQAANPHSPYYAWFCQHEKIVDDILRRQRFGPADVAGAVERILSARRPRLRYLVGRWARVIVALRRHIPGELFDRAYFGLVRRLVTRPRERARGLSSAADLG